MTPTITSLDQNKISQFTQIVTKEEIWREGRELGFVDNAIRVIEKRYLVRNEQGEIIETPKGMFRRIAKALAEVEIRYGATEEQVKYWEEEFYSLLSRFEFTPAGRTITNAGGPTRVVANCIVLHFEDSMDGIFSTLRDASLLQQAGSGLGFAWHLLRPAGTVTVASRGQASGPVSFLHAYNTAFGVIKQQGRHGANMGVMRVDHPDILEFIECKRKEGILANFNVSISLTDEFMQAVKADKPEPWLCEWRGNKMKPRLVKRNNRGAYISHEEVNITARELMDKIVESAWGNGEPGVLFPDEANRTNPVPHLGRLEATNPCGEQFLHDGDVCNLGSINLARFVKAGQIEEERLQYATSLAVRMLDNVIDVSDFPVAKINDRFRDNRRVGLGIMGFADMLYQLGLAYNSEEGLKTAERVMQIVNDAAHTTSEELAQQKGIFPNWEKSIFGPQGENRPRRNAALTTVAPTGSISMFFDCSSGVEPFFALAYYKEVMGGERLPYFNTYFEEALHSRGLYSDELLQDVLKTGTIQHRTDLPEDLRKTFVTAMDISAEDHIRMQAAFQKHTDNSISKTINFKNSATKQEVHAGYMLAWELGCKGCTVYRDGSRDEQVLNLNTRKEEKTTGTAEATAQTIHVLEPRPRPEVLRGTTYKLKTAYGNLYITINEDGNGPFEVFSQMGKAGGFFAANLEAICRMISLSLRSGVHIESVIRQLKGIRDPQPIWHKGEMILSLPDAIGQILEKHIKSPQNRLDLQWGQSSDELQKPVRLVLEKGTSGVLDNGFAPACPDCGGVLAWQEGCAKCGTCGFSRCG
ncbi:MAG: Ribonucleoside-diphosphate reductase [Candidatus Magasanikbacteria bacterium GW2011_GWA2_50_22]|uniref:Vitamin B12-dependent ribonucleotide reductase n=1 Tax=Candidatus Magasanikbacteria bacterium GW2011_GWA2_50_22 TaxID=1619043 RepID=A0A0G1WF14_9BACT|nr:MAG: Ribonucleoside-diphosphate reductase [Candidatus Magasanikbacteria bacterium GW2011_GWA2_50_22]